MVEPNARIFNKFSKQFSTRNIIIRKDIMKLNINCILDVKDYWYLLIFYSVFQSYLYSFWDTRYTRLSSFFSSSFLLIFPLQRFFFIFCYLVLFFFLSLFVRLSTGQPVTFRHRGIAGRTIHTQKGRKGNWKNSSSVTVLQSTLRT